MIYHFGDCALDTRLYSVQRGGQCIRLRPKVFRACLYLLEHRDRVVSREELCAQVWPGRLVNPATLEGVIRSVRQALGDSGRAQGIILTRHRYGYRFVAEVEESYTEGGQETGRLSSALRIAAATSSLARTEVATSWGAFAQELEAMPVPERLSEPDARGAGQKGLGVGGKSVPDFEERRGLRRRSGGGWSMIHLGLASVIIPLMVLAGWGLWSKIREPAEIPLDKSRIAVLPFIDVSAEANQASLADGMTQELIAQLAQMQGLTVIARTSVLKYKGTLMDVGSIGRELRVGTILEGSVRTVDNHVRVNAQLVDVASQGHLWSQEYDRELRAGLGVESDIAARLAKSLKERLTPVEKRRAALQAQAENPSF
jgi:TolB-like protein/DNA-binding winged helix-turn-helix (wHTH) protein